MDQPSQLIKRLEAQSANIVGESSQFMARLQSRSPHPVQEDLSPQLLEMMGRFDNRISRFEHQLLTAVDAKMSRFSPGSAERTARFEKQPDASTGSNATPSITPSVSNSSTNPEIRTLLKLRGVLQQQLVQAIRRGDNTERVGLLSKDISSVDSELVRVEAAQGPTGEDLHASALFDMQPRKLFANSQQQQPVTWSPTAVHAQSIEGSSAKIDRSSLPTPPKSFNCLLGKISKSSKSIESDDDSDDSLCSDEDEAAASQIQESHRVPNNHFGLDQSMKMALGLRGMHTPNRKRNDAQPSSAKLIRVTK